MTKNQILRRRHFAILSFLVFGVSSMALSVSSARAATFDYNNYDIKWDTTLKYSAILRTGQPDSKHLSGPDTGANNGDYAFNQGALASNRVDVLTGVDFNLHDPYDLGFRISGEGFYDSVYNGTHNSYPALQNNNYSVGPNKFSATTQRIDGRDIRLDDAFVHGHFNLGDHLLTMRLGRHTVVWGESLFAGENGIGGAMSAIDWNKLLSNPQIEAKEVYLPTTQLSTSLGLTDTFSVEGYYQFEYRQDRFAGPGSFLDPVDIYLQGSERILLGTSVLPTHLHAPAPAFVSTPATGGFALFHGQDQSGSNWHGNYGTALKYNNPDTNIDAGLYYIHYADHLGTQLGTTSLSVPNLTTGQVGSYYFINPTGIDLYGASLSSSLGPWNIAGELSARKNNDLVTKANSPTFARGDTLHANVSALYSGSASKYWDNISFSGEFSAQHLISATKNASVLQTGYARTDETIYADLTTSYYQVIPNLDLSPDLSGAFNLSNTSVIDRFSMTPGHSGNIKIGVNATYKINWLGSLAFVKQLGSAAANSLSDRDYISASISRSF